MIDLTNPREVLKTPTWNNSIPFGMNIFSIRGHETPQTTVRGTILCHLSSVHGDSPPQGLEFAGSSNRRRSSTKSLAKNRGLALGNRESG